MVEPVLSVDIAETFFTTFSILLRFLVLCVPVVFAISSSLFLSLLVFNLPFRGTILTFLILPFLFCLSLLVLFRNCLIRFATRFRKLRICALLWCCILNFRMNLLIPLTSLLYFFLLFVVLNDLLFSTAVFFPSAIVISIFLFFFELV